MVKKVFLFFYVQVSCVYREVKITKEGIAMGQMFNSYCINKFNEYLSGLPERIGDVHKSVDTNKAQG